MPFGGAGLHESWQPKIVVGHLAHRSNDPRSARIPPRLALIVHGNSYRRELGEVRALTGSGVHADMMAVKSPRRRLCFPGTGRNRLLHSGVLRSASLATAGGEISILISFELSGICR
jgi:hypothetical protein